LHVQENSKERFKKQIHTYLLILGCCAKLIKFFIEINHSDEENLDSIDKEAFEVINVWCSRAQIVSLLVIFLETTPGQCKVI
jgi:hypothetical protein